MKRILYNTEYIVWNNFGMTGETRTCPLTVLPRNVLDMVDIHKGTIFKFHQYCFTSANYFRNLEMLEYDMIYGGEFVYGGENPFFR
jgi:hypothetical protein